MFSKSISALAVVAVGAGVVKAQVTATGTMGTTNPPAATMGTAINQTSDSRLLSVNAIDDFCIYGPPVEGGAVGNDEAIMVAYCVQPRNNARVIPDGTLQAVHFVSTPLYVQITGQGDLTKIGVQAGDEGGELDPHGATGLGNPVGGNVTSNITGTDVSYQEWMNYVSYSEFCIRVCVAENSTYSAANECQHTLDEMGCEWVMPGNYENNSFTSCEADAAYPPGWYPLANGSTSTFQQRYTGTYTNADGQTEHWTQGYTVTPQTAYSTPASSNCVTYASVSNGIASLAVAAEVSQTTGGSSGLVTSATASGSTVTMSASSSMATAARSSSGSGSMSASSMSKSASASATESKSGAMATFGGSDSFGSLIIAGFSAFAVVAGASAMFL